MSEPTPETPAERVTRVEGEAIVTWIRRPGNRPYRYDLHLQALTPFFFVGASTLVGAIWWAVTHGVWGWRNAAALALFAGFGLWAFWVVLHWVLFSRRCYIIMRDDAMLVGRGPRAWSIPVSLLNRETIDIAAMGRVGLTTELPIRVDGQVFRLLLLGPFVNLRNHRTFISELLQHLIPDEPGEADADEPAPEAP